MRLFAYIAVAVVVAGFIAVTASEGSFQDSDTARQSIGAIKAPSDDWTRKRER